MQTPIAFGIVVIHNGIKKLAIFMAIYCWINMYKLRRKILHLIFTTLFTLQSVLYPWISILPAPPPVYAQESPPLEASYSAQTPAPTPLDPLLDLDTIFPSTQSADTTPPEEIPEATTSATPEVIPEDPISTPSATPSTSPSPSSTPSPTPSETATLSPPPTSDTVSQLDSVTTQEAPSVQPGSTPTAIDPFLISLTYPFKGTYPISYLFGEESNSSYVRLMQSLFEVDAHDGVDFGMPEGTSVLATGPGEIIHAGQGLYGITVIIRHSWGNSYYGHLSQTSVTVGDKVSTGQEIGLSGNTGISTAPHLHFGIRPNHYDPYNGYRGMIDPLPYLSGTVLGVATSFVDLIHLPAKTFKNDDFDISIPLLATDTSKLSFALTHPDGSTHFIYPTIYNFGTGDTLILPRPNPFIPGRYTLTVTTGDQEQDSESFAWGVLALNTDSAHYQTGDNAKFSLAVLDDLGKMVCDAKLSLIVRSPSKTYTLDQDNRGIIVNENVCSSYDLTLSPDYAAHIESLETGLYQLTLNARFDGHTYSITDSFMVSESPTYSLKRQSATRLYPLNEYPMIFRLETKDSQSLTLKDTVPDSFTTKPLSQADLTHWLPTLEDNAQLVTSDTLSWDLTLEPNTPYYFGYSYDAPDESPRLYSIGPATLGDLVEERSWSLAIDATAPVVGFFSPPLTWTSVGDANISLTYPDPRADDLMVAVVAVRPSTVTIDTPAGWTLLDSRTGTDGGAEGVDAGSVGVYWFSKVATGSEGLGTETFTKNNTASVIMGQIMQVRSSTGTYDISASGYSIDGDATAWGGTLTDDIGLLEGDLVLITGAQNGNVSASSAWGITAPGITSVSTTNNEHGEFNSATGNDIEVGLASQQIWEGSNTATPTVTLTQGTLSSGVVQAVRIRQGSGTRRTDTWVRSAGRQVAGSTSVAVGYPEHDPGDLLVLFVGSRASTDPTPTTPAGWTSLGTYTGGAGTFGADAGDARTTAFYRTAESRYTGTLAVTTNSANTALGQIVSVHRDDSGSWSIDSDGGGDSSAGTDWSVTGTGLDLSSASGGDLVMIGSSINSDARTFDSHALSASGITFGDVTQTAEYRSGTNNDMSLVLTTARVASGTGSAAPTFTMNASGSGTNDPAGSSLFIKINAGNQTSPDTAVGLFSPERVWTAAGNAALNLVQPDPRENDLLVATIAIRPSASTVNTPAGWTLLDSRTGTDGGAEGADTGSVGLYTFYKLADGSEGTSTQQFTENGTTSVWTGSIMQVRSETGTYDLDAAGRDINGDTTAWSGALDSDPGLTQGDLVILWAAQNGNPSNTSNWDLQAAGLDQKSTVNEHGEFTSNTGNDIEIGVANTIIWEGTNTTTPEVVLTQSSATSGAVVAIRIRQGAGTVRSDTWVRSAGVQVTSTTSLAVPYPDHNIGNLIVLFVTSRDSTDPTPDTPYGWTSLGTYTGGAGTYGDDAGNARISAFYKTADTRFWATQTVNITGANNSIGQMISVHKDDISSWDIDSDGGGDSSAGTDWSVTGSSIDLDSTNGGDIMLVGSAINTDARLFSAHTLSASGITFGDVTQTAEYRSATGNDSTLVVSTGRVSSGSGTAVAPTFAMTANGSGTNDPTGSSLLVKVLGISSNPTINVSGTADGNDGATVKIAINSSTQSESTTISSGVWEIASVPLPVSGDTVTVWVDNVADNLESTGITNWSSSNITGMVLNTNILTIGSDQDQSLSVTNLNQYDCTQDEDIMHQAVSSHLKVEGDACAGSTTNSYTSEKLTVLSGDTLVLATSETITTYDLENAGTITVTGNGTLNVLHDWANTGTFTADTSTVNLNGADSTTQTISGTTTFNNLAASTTSNSTGRTIRYTAGSTTTVTGTWTMTGTNTKTLTLESSSASTWIITPTAASVSYVSVSYSKNHGVDFCATNTTDGGNNTRWRTTCEPSAQSFQRKTFYDDQNSRYWRFSSDGTDIDAEYSSDGSSWNTSTTLPYNTNDFSVEYKSISGTEYVVLAVATDHDIVVRRGTLGASSVTWDGTSSVALNGASSTDSYSYPTLSLNTSNSVWVSARYYDGTSYILATNSTSYIPDTITHEETETGHTDDPGSTVTTDANLTAVTGDLYLASIGMKLNYAVTTVTGLGLTWNLLDAQCSGRSQSRVEIWYAQGTPSGDGTVTADITSGVEDSVIAVSRYSGVSTTDALGALVSANSNGDEGACSGGTDANSYSTSLTTTANNSLIFSAITLRQESHTPGTGYTERADRNSTNVNTGTRGSVATQEKIITSAGVNTVDGSTTSTTNVDYAVIATEVLPFISEYTVDQTVSSWVWSTSPYQLGMSDATDLLYSSISPLPNEDMYVTMRNSDAILGCIWDASDGNWEDSSGSSCQVQTGTAWLNSAWGYRTKLTIDNTKLGSDVSDYPLYIDLSDLPAGFHTNVNQTDGRDIRVTKADGTTELPREVVFYDNATDTGELHAKYTGTLSSGSPTDIYIYYGNAGASDYATTDTYGRNNVWTSYHSVWHLQETSGSGAYIIDATGNGHDATPTNTTSTTGKLGNGRSFDGNGDFLTVASPSLPTGDYTYESWGYRNTLTNDHAIFMSSDGGSTNEVLLQAMASTDTNANSLRYTANGISAYSTTDLTSGTWQAMSMTRATATTTGYIDGTADATTGSEGDTLNFSTCDLFIGQDVDSGCSGGGFEWFDGILDELRISSTARTSAWMSTIYNNQNNPATFYSSFGTQESRLNNADSIDTTTTLSSDYLSLLSDGTDLHLAYVDDETTDQISYRRYSAGSWSAATLVADAASNDDAFPTISLDSTNTELYILWVDSSTSDIYYSSCETSTGCDDPSEWSAETNHQSTGSNLQITSNITAAEKIFYLYSDGTTLMWDEISIGGSNTAPDAPTSLLQLTTGDVTLSTGDWHNSTSIKFSATATDTDNPDTLQLCIEIDQLGTGFSNTEDSCGTGGSYTGSGITLTHTITVTDAQEYHWQARVKDVGGLYSTWVSYGGNAESARDIGVDTTASTGGTVYDGSSTGVDTTFATSSLSALSANWDSFNTDVSGLLRYDYSIGTSAGATDIKTWTDNTTSTSVTATGLTLQTSQLYYVNVRAVDNAGNVQSGVSSNGQMVAPSISFAITPATTTFSNLSPGNSYESTGATTLTTSTNAYNGYVIRAFTTDLLKSLGGTHQISNFSGGSYASPATWSGSETGFGYTSSDTNVSGSNKFGGGTLYAPFSQTGPGDIVADHTANIEGTSITGETFDITYKVKVPSSQAATNYTSTVVYTATAQY